VIGSNRNGYGWSERDFGGSKAFHSFPYDGKAHPPVKTEQYLPLFHHVDDYTRMVADVLETYGPLDSSQGEEEVNEVRYRRVRYGHKLPTGRMLSLGIGSGFPW